MFTWFHTYTDKHTHMHGHTIPEEILEHNKHYHCLLHVGVMSSSSYHMSVGDRAGRWKGPRTILQHC